LAFLVQLSIGIAEDVRGVVAVNWRWLRQHFVHNRFSEAVYGSVDETPMKIKSHTYKEDNFVLICLQGNSFPEAASRLPRQRGCATAHPTPTPSRKRPSRNMEPSA